MIYCRKPNFTNGLTKQRPSKLKFAFENLCYKYLLVFLTISSTLTFLLLFFFHLNHLQFLQNHSWRGFFCFCIFFSSIFHHSLLLSIFHAIRMRALLCFSSSPPSRCYLLPLLIIAPVMNLQQQHGKMGLIAVHGMVSRVIPSLVT